MGEVDEEGARACGEFGYAGWGWKSALDEWVQNVAYCSVGLWSADSERADSARAMDLPVEYFILNV